MALAASRSLWEQTGPSDVYVDLVGVSSNHGVGTITLDIDVVVTTEPGLGTLNLIRPARRPRRRPRIAFPDPESLPQPLDTIVDLVGPVRTHGVGVVTVFSPFNLTDDEIALSMALLADE